MKISQAFLLVDDQDAAKTFYTEVLGFEVETDVDSGDFRWLSLRAPGPDGGTDALIDGTVGNIVCLHQD